MVCVHYSLCSAGIHRRVAEVYGKGAWMERMWRNGVCCSKMVWLTCMKSYKLDANCLTRKIWKIRKIQNLGKEGDSQFLNYTKNFSAVFRCRTRKLLQNISIQETPNNIRPATQNRRRDLLTRAVFCYTTMREETPIPGHAHYPNTSSGKVSKIRHTAPTLHQVIITSFCKSRNFCPSRIWRGAKRQKVLPRTG